MKLLSRAIMLAACVQVVPGLAQTSIQPRASLQASPPPASGPADDTATPEAEAPFAAAESKHALLEFRIPYSAFNDRVGYFLVGRMISIQEIDWITGGRSTWSWPDPRCSVLIKSSSHLITLKGLPEAQLSFSEESPDGTWIAVEAPPDKNEVTLQIRSISDPHCRAEVLIHYNWQRNKDIKPISPIMAAPDVRIPFQRADLMFHRKASGLGLNLANSILTGARRISFGTAEQPSNAILSLPTAVLSLEWREPFWNHLGLALSYEQARTNFGAVKAFLSDSRASIFFEQFFVRSHPPFRVRLQVGYLQHLFSILGTNTGNLTQGQKSAKLVFTGLDARALISRRWVLGTGFNYGWPQSTAGVGEKQSYLDAFANFEFFLYSWLTFIGQGTLQRHSTQGVPAVNSLGLEFGLRLYL